MIELEDIKTIMSAAFASCVIVAIIVSLLELFLNNISPTPAILNTGQILAIISIVLGFLFLFTWVLFIFKGGATYDN